MTRPKTHVILALSFIDATDPCSRFRRLINHYISCLESALGEQVDQHLFVTVVYLPTTHSLNSLPLLYSSVRAKTTPSHSRSNSILGVRSGVRVVLPSHVKPQNPIVSGQSSRIIQIFVSKYHQIFKYFVLKLSRQSRDRIGELPFSSDLNHPPAPRRGRRAASERIRSTEERVTSVSIPTPPSRGVKCLSTLPRNRLPLFPTGYYLASFSPPAELLNCFSVFLQPISKKF